MNSKKFITRLLIFLIGVLTIDMATSAALLKGLRRFYGFNGKPVILINGSSMSLSGFNKSEIERKLGKQVAIYAKEGVGVEDRHVMLEQFFSNDPGTVKTVIYELNPLLFSKTYTAANVYTIFYPYMDNPAIDRYIYDRAPVEEYVAHKIFRASRFDVFTINMAIKGFMNSYENFKTNALDSTTKYYSKDDVGKVKVEMSPERVVVFQNSLRLIRKKNAKVVLVMMPIYYQKKTTFDPVTFNNLETYFRNLSDSGSGISYLNLNTPGITKNAELYSDLLHLNRAGQDSVTKAIVRFFDSEFSQETHNK